MIDVLGFIGSGLIVVSLTMKSIIRLRLVGLVGARVFIAYGIWLGAWPVVATNTVTFSIHVVRLREAMGERSGRSQGVAAEQPVLTNGTPSLVLAGSDR